LESVAKVPFCYAWHWTITQIAENFLPASHDGFAIVVETFDGVAPEIQMPA
jgi:hypothetical protein